MKLIYLIPIVIILLNSCNESEPPLVHGCTDPSAINYDASATSDDGSCILPSDTVTFAIEAIIYEHPNYHHNSANNRIAVLDVDDNSSLVGSEIITSDYSTPYSLSSRLKVNTYYRVRLLDENGFQIAYGDFIIENYNGGHIANQIVDYSGHNSGGDILSGISMDQTTSGFRIEVRV